MPYRLSSYDPSLAEAIAGWPVDSAEREAWASLSEQDAGPSIFERWHADPGVHPYVLRRDGQACGYGEVWEDPAEHEAELARIIVDPAVRGQGAGRALTRLLAERARELGYRDVWLRVLPENHGAIACYLAVGLERVEPALERSFNSGQPREYWWMRYDGGPAVGDATTGPRSL
jgi:ribosomal protein S18 acetylase RimI-like enzyme